MIADIELTAGFAEYWKQTYKTLPYEIHFKSRARYQQGLIAKTYLLPEDSAATLVERLAIIMTSILNNNIPTQASRLIFSPYDPSPNRHTSAQFFVPNYRTLKNICKELESPFIVYRYGEMNLDKQEEREAIVVKARVKFDKGTKKMIKRINFPDPLNVINEGE